MEPRAVLIRGQAVPVDPGVHRRLLDEDCSRGGTLPVRVDEIDSDAAIAPSLLIKLLLSVLLLLLLPLLPLLLVSRLLLFLFRLNDMYLCKRTCLGDNVGPQGVRSEREEAEPGRERRARAERRERSQQAEEIFWYQPSFGYVSSDGRTVDHSSLLFARIN